MLLLMKGGAFMATSSFTRKIVLGEEAVDKIIEMMDDTSENELVNVPEYTLNDKEFMEKCLGLVTCK